MIQEVNRLYQELLSNFPKGISSTSTNKFNDIKDLFKEKYNLGDEDIYATGAGNRPGNLEVRLSQGVQATKHTALGLAFLIDKKGNEDARNRLTESTFVTIEKSLGRGKASYDNILIFVDSNDVLYPAGLMYSDESTLKDALCNDFEIALTKLATQDAQESQVDIENGSLVSDSSKDDFLKIGQLQNIILYGPPGTGKTHAMQRLISSLSDDSAYFSTTFHQSLVYEDFVEGIKPVMDDERDDEGDGIDKDKQEKTSDVRYKIEKGIFYNACETAVSLAGYSSLSECINDEISSRKERLDKAIEDNKIALLCIDEINRGNVASIFGELITLIEETKRLGAECEMTAILPYSKRQFGVPTNLKIIATMNTADRSIQLLDTALRRRFQFIELLPDYSVFETTDNDENKEVKDMAKKILQRINARIRCLLSKDNQIGHSYLMNATTKKEIVFVIINKIIPLLEEYFYNEIDKVRFVLNENNSTKYPFYIKDLDANAAYKSYLSFGHLEDEDKNFYMVDRNVASATEEDCGNYLKHLIGENE